MGYTVFLAFDFNIMAEWDDTGHILGVLLYVIILCGCVLCIWGSALSFGTVLAIC